MEVPKIVEVNDNLYQIGELYRDEYNNHGVLVGIKAEKDEVLFVLRNVTGNYAAWVDSTIFAIDHVDAGIIIPATKINKLAIELIQYQEAMDHQDPDQTHNEMQLIEFLNDECDSEEQYQNAIVTAMRTLGVSK